MKTAIILCVCTLLVVTATVVARRHDRGGQQPGSEANLHADAGPRPHDRGPDPAEAAAVHAAAERAFQQRLIEEVRDPAWASAASASLRADLTRAAAAGKFDVKAVDCKRTMCAATIDWANYDSARESYAVLLNTPYELRCGRSVYIPEPEDRSAPYRATTYFFACEGRT
jgi:hypothetical protein